MAAVSSFPVGFASPEEGIEAVLANVGGNGHLDRSRNSEPRPAFHVDGFAVSVRFDGGAYGSCEQGGEGIAELAFSLFVNF
jgi:hypothetical protein